jgi:hypothetical protein
MHRLQLKAEKAKLQNLLRWKANLSKLETLLKPSVEVPQANQKRMGIIDRSAQILQMIAVASQSVSLEPENNKNKKYWKKSVIQLFPKQGRVAKHKCYASLVYGTRKSKWIQLQQATKTFFYNKICEKVGFSQSELKFFQSARQAYA